MNSLTLNITKFACAVALVFSMAIMAPTQTHALDAGSAIQQIQGDILNAYYRGDQQLVLELFSVLFEIVILGDIDLSNGNSGSGNLDVETTKATKIDGDEARLNGEIDFNNADRAYVWFEYGEDEDDLDEETSRKFIDEDDDEDFYANIDDLDEDDRYYFRAVAEDRDTDRVTYGDIETFRADDSNSNNNDDPEVDTDDADDVQDDRAELNGSVDMNDFKNGLVFFVWGQDEDDVEDVEDEDEYNDIDEQGDDLQKQRVDSDLDGDDDYSLDVKNLDDDTDYFFTLCVEYEDEDDDQQIVCGNIEEFETDRD